MRKIFYLILLSLVCIPAFSQNTGGITVFATVYYGDTIPMGYLDPVLVTTYIEPLTPQEKKTYSKLIRDVKKAYPYAKEAENLLNSYSRVISNAQNESQKEKIRKQAMRDIENKLYDKAKKLSKPQGKILSKLIYRQTGRSSYTLIKNFAGGTRTALINATCKAMGVKLDVKFDPSNSEEDRMIDRIIFCIDNGKL